MTTTINFKAERLNRGKSIDAFAADVGVTPDVIRHLEAGGQPRPANALKVAAYFGLTVTHVWPPNRKDVA